MAEGGAIPIRRVVALLTGCREVGLHVVGARRAIEIGLVAGNALRVVGQIIGPTGAEGRVVALRALQRYVRTGKGETSGRVVERAACPIRRVMALLTCRREA